VFPARNARFTPSSSFNDSLNTSGREAAKNTQKNLGHQTDTPKTRQEKRAKERRTAGQKSAKKGRTFSGARGHRNVEQITAISRTVTGRGKGRNEISVEGTLCKPSDRKIFSVLEFMTDDGDLPSPVG
jgi:hypothetical protein